MRVTLALLLAAMASFAADFPQPTGHVNDFVQMLPDADRQNLEYRLRAYEQATSIEIAVAIVPSLQDETVDDFARGLFQAWGIGKRDKNNGVLFLWAPNERKVRIQVGYGLEEALPNAAAAQIVREVTSLFRREEFTRGVYAGVEGVIDRLDHGGSDSTIPIAALIAGLALLIGAVVVLQYRRHKTRELTATLPETLARCARQLQQAGKDYPEAVNDLASLRQEAPGEVYRDLDAGLEEAPATLARLREDLTGISLQSRQNYRELRAVERAIRKWQHALSKLANACDEIRTRLASFRDSRRRAPELMATIPGEIARYADGNPRLMEAAEATLAKAQEEAQAPPPVNWLLVHDLLLDAQDCVQRAQALARGERPAPRSRTGRRWADSDASSPAIVVIDNMFPVIVSSSSSGYDSGGGASSGGGDFGGFGGGDTGSGGASGSY